MAFLVVMETTTHPAFLSPAKIGRARTVADGIAPHLYGCPR
jgi:hypothetical protein